MSDKMKKSAQSQMAKYREIGIRRRHEAMKMRSDEIRCYPKKKPPDIPLPGKKVKCTKHHPIVPECDPFNPYYVPVRDRMFTKKIRKRKQKLFKTDGKELRTVTDNVHGEFYEVVEGRPVRPINDIQVYMENIRQICLTKANIGYRRDQILNVDYKKNDIEYIKCVEMYKNMLSMFKIFLLNCFQLTQSAVEKAEKVAAKVAEAQEKLESICFEYGTLRNQLYVLVDRNELLHKYQEFLLKISPIWWRLKNDVGFMGRSVIAKKLFMSESETGETDSLGSFSTYEKTSSKKNITILQVASCNLFFESPKDIMSLFDDISFQCRRYMYINKWYSTIMIKPLLRWKKYLVNELAQDSENVKDLIDSFDKHVKWMEERADEIEAKFYKLLYNHFQELITSYEYSKLYANLFFINKKVLGNIADTGDNIRYLMKLIEQEYFQISLDLDFLDYDVVQKITKVSLLQDKEMMKKAYLAQRELKEWVVFEKALHSSFEPPRNKNKKR